jgi:peptidyl-prolyl cis-trans isomerase A (cyclophilin A)
VKPIALVCPLALLMAACSGPPGKEPAAAPPKIEPTPAEFRAKFQTSKGDFVIQVTREWAPRGADRFYELVKTGFYNNQRFFRVRPTFVVQWGINGDPKTSQLWANFRILDDPVKEPNRRGTVAFAKSGPASRTTQVFINMADNSRTLDETGFAVFGKVAAGMEVVESLYAGYGEMAPRGTGPDPTRISMEGNAYLEAKFPRLDSIKKAVVE